MSRIRILMLSALLSCPDTVLASDDAPQGCGKSEAARRLAASAPDDRPGDGGFRGADETDVLHYNLELEIKPSTRAIDGRQTMTVVSLVDGLSTFQFRLKDNLKVTLLQVNGVDATWTHIDSATIEVTLDPPRIQDEQFDVYVAYNGRPASEGFGSIQIETRRAWTLSETWFAYTWVPLKDVNGDKATAELAFIVPKTLIVASNGSLLGVDDLENDRKRYRWQTDYPIAPYLISFAAGEYSQYDRTWDYGDVHMPLQFFIYTWDDNESNRAAWFQSSDMLTVFSERYGLYPFVNEKYGMAEFGWGGGMEHQTCTSQGGFWESVTAHELSHQWWGDNVTCETWHDIWLNEGFATFSEAVWYEGKGGGSLDAYFNHIRSRKPGDTSGSVYVYDDSDLNRIFSYEWTYKKGAWVLHMLRHVMGDDDFFATLGDYRARYEGATAITDEFQAVAEEFYGGDLDWFFGQWVYDVGSPAYRFASRKITVDGREYVELYVKQVQTDPYPLFTMPIDIVTIVNDEKTTNLIWNDEWAEHFVIPTSGKATSVQFDPNQWILASYGGTTFVEGPPEIVTMSPAPGERIVPKDDQAIRVGFHKNVNVSEADLALADADGNAVAFDLEYDASVRAVTLTLLSRLHLGEYTLTVSDSIKDVPASLNLDGEIKDPTDPASLPSGEGLPGGSAVVNFTVVPPRGDMDCSGDVSFDDIDGFVTALISREEYESEYPDCAWLLGDINGDGDVNFDDLDGFVECLINNACP